MKQTNVSAPKFHGIGRKIIYIFVILSADCRIYPACLPIQCVLCYIPICWLNPVFRCSQLLLASWNLTCLSASNLFKKNTPKSWCLVSNHPVIHFNVCRTIINHPPNHNFDRWYGINHSQSWVVGIVLPTLNHQKSIHLLMVQFLRIPQVPRTKPIRIPFESRCRMPMPVWAASTVTAASWPSQMCAMRGWRSTWSAPAVTGGLGWGGATSILPWGAEMGFSWCFLRGLRGLNGVEWDLVMLSSFSSPDWRLGFIVVDISNWLLGIVAGVHPAHHKWPPGH